MNRTLLLKHLTRSLCPHQVSHRSFFYVCIDAVLRVSIGHCSHIVVIDESRAGIYMTRLLTLYLTFVAVHGNDGSSSGAPSSLVQNAPSVSFLPASDSPASPEQQDIPTTSRTFPVTSFSPTTTNGFQDLKPNCGDCFW